MLGVDVKGLQCTSVMTVREQENECRRAKLLYMLENEVVFLKVAREKIGFVYCTK